jgi:uncharacterized protein YjbJ (UPF0337 family)
VLAIRRLATLAGKPVVSDRPEREPPRQKQTKVEVMVDMGNQDDLKGRVKEAAGDLKDDKDLKREGKVDRAAGAAKEGIDKAADKAKNALHSH